MSSVYFRNTRSGKKGHRQPRPRHFKYSTSAAGPYAIEPSDSVLWALGCVASGLTGSNVALDRDLREYLVLGSWSGLGASCVAFTHTPELVSAMVSVRGVPPGDVRSAVDNVCAANPGANAPSVVEHSKEHMSGGRVTRNTVVQVSGRLAPHVADELKRTFGDTAKCDMTFCNMTQAHLCFCVTVPSGTYIRTMSPGSLHMLSEAFPPWSACISQPVAPYYKIVCEPDANGFRMSANKNSCCMLYADGRMRFQGAVRDCARAAAALREALATMMISQHCKVFLSRLVEHLLDDEGEEEEASQVSGTTSTPGSFQR